MADIRLYQGDCLDILPSLDSKIELTICDPPFNQKKEYAQFDDNQNPKEYWKWITCVLKQIYRNTSLGGAIYFMHREKNLEHIFRAMRSAKWNYQNLIIWRKMTRATPTTNALAKKYQVIYYGIKGDSPRIHNTLYGNTPMLAWHKKDSSKGVKIDDLWYDIRELTAGFFSGKEIIRNTEGRMAHDQQMPVALALRMILLSTSPGDTVLDPFLGSGTSLVVAKQINRVGIGIEIDRKNIDLAKKRLVQIRPQDDVDQYYGYYSTSKKINSIWGYRDQKTLEYFAEE